MADDSGAWAQKCADSSIALPKWEGQGTVHKKNPSGRRDKRNKERQERKHKQLCKVRVKGKRVMKQEPKVINILANGERVSSIEGKVIPSNNAVYEQVLKGAKKK